MLAFSKHHKARNKRNDDGGQPMERKTIDLGGGYRLAVMDERNWKLQVHRAAAECNLTKDASAKWRDTGNYFQTLGAALAYVYERRMREEGAPDEALADAMARAQAVRDELLAVR